VITTVLAVIDEGSGSVVDELDAARATMQVPALTADRLVRTVWVNRVLLL
jgi:hypothetical protein